MPTTTSHTGFAALRPQLQSALLASYPEHFARTGWSCPQILAHQRRQLQLLLAHAAAHSPFHARRLAGIDLTAIDPRQMTPLPVMTKAEMMGELDDVFTDRRLTDADVEQALAAAGTEPAVLLGSYLALTSGGSSGQRGVFVLDLPAATQFYGSLTRGLAARIAALGGPPPGGLPAAMVAAGSPLRHRNRRSADGRGRAAVPARSYTGDPAASGNRRAAQRPAGTRAVRLPHRARPARRRATGRPAADRRTRLPARAKPAHPSCATITDGFHVPLIDGFGSTEGLVGSSKPGEEAIVFARRLDRRAR